MTARLSRLLTRIIDWFYWKPFRIFMPLQTFRYAACGGLNMCLDTLLYYVTFHYILCKQDVNLGIVVVSAPIFAMCIVFPITLFNGFWLNRHIAFRESPLKGTTQLVRYLLSVGGALALNYACMKIFVDALNIYPTPSKLLSTLVTIVYSYLMQKYFTFRGCLNE